MNRGHHPLDVVLEQAGSHASDLEQYFDIPVLLVVGEGGDSDGDTIAGQRRDASVRALAAAAGFGAARSWVVPIQPAAPGAADRKLSFGRSESCDVVLPFVEVSKHHGFLERDGDAWFVSDAGSKNGTAVDGQKVGEARVPLTDACTLELGRVKARYLSAPRFVAMLRQALKAL